MTMRTVIISCSLLVYSVAWYGLSAFPTGLTPRRPDAFQCAYAVHSLRQPSLHQMCDVVAYAFSPDTTSLGIVILFVRRPSNAVLVSSADPLRFVAGNDRPRRMSHVDMNLQDRRTATEPIETVSAIHPVSGCIWALTFCRALSSLGIKAWLESCATCWLFA